MRLTFTRRARRDLLDAIDRYAAQSPQLGERFVEEIDRQIEAICAAPHSFPRHTRIARRVTMRVFPYKIFCAVRKGRVEFSASYHHARDPERWRKH